MRWGKWLSGEHGNSVLPAITSHVSRSFCGLWPVTLQQLYGIRSLNLQNENEA